MAKNKVSEWSSTPSNNNDIGGINISEGCAPSGINNAIRELMAQVKDMQAGTDSDSFTVGGNLSVTGTTTLTGAATAPTPSTSDDSTKIATTAFVKDVALPDLSGNGIAVRTAALTLTPRTITAGTGITVTDGDGVSGNPTIANSGVTSVDGKTGAVTTLVSGTAVSVSGTSVDFTGIPSWVKRITIMLNGVSTSGTSNYLMQIGTSSGIENTSYASQANTFNSSPSGSISTSGFLLLNTVIAANTYSGVIPLCTLGSNLWVASGVISSNAISGGQSFFGGNKTLSGTLDRIRITTVNGTDTFDAGTINILYE